MPDDIAALIDRLEEDPWRAEVGFSPEVEGTLGRILKPGLSDESIVEALNEWLAKHQPCLFGRIAAKHGLLSYCLLTEDDLSASDNSIKDKIQEARLAWTRLAFEGKASGFVIVSRLSWKWRKRSAVKLTERTHEETTEALHRRREGRRSEAASGRERAGLAALRRTRPAADGILSLAERIL
jgi:dGTP triphosphohydrolase